VIAALAEVSAQTRSAFLDLTFLRKQRQRSGGASSRSWYVTVDHWLTGTIAATEAAQAFGGEEVREGACWVAGGCRSNAWVLSVDPGYRHGAGGSLADWDMFLLLQYPRLKVKVLLFHHLLTTTI